IGFAFDGDGDRLGVADETGDLLWPQEVFALVADDLLANPPEGVEKAGIARTLPTSIWLDRVAESHNVGLTETPVGFKYLSQFLLSGEALIAGEESGGIGFGFHLPERDGLMAALLLLTRLGRERKRLSVIRREFRERHGDLSYHRVDLPITPEIQVRVRADSEAIGQAVCEALGADQSKVRTVDGVKVMLPGGWVMLRASGTEPLLRIYAEAENRAEVDRLIEVAAATVESLG
ncbi:phosphoglucomutase/phosphomannomutase family protein, partial [bacterium]|nr:phosphoglucomutase/phosphomannomutase family protein [bacterium]